MCFNRTLTLKVDLFHDVLGLDALLLAEDEDLSVLVLRPAVLVHPHLHLSVWTHRDTFKYKQIFHVCMSMIVLGIMSLLRCPAVLSLVRQTEVRTALNKTMTGHDVFVAGQVKGLTQRVSQHLTQ